MTEILNAKCRYCNKPLELEVDPAGYSMFTPEVLQAMAACNRCSDFKEAQRRMLNRADVLASALATGNADTKAKAKMALVKLGKQWVVVLCQLYHLENMWSDEIEDMLLSNTHRLEHVLKTVQDMLRGEFTRRKQERLERLNRQTA